MALRTKTIEFAFQSRNTSLASATRYDFTAITLYIPEVTSRTFRSVRVQVFCRDNVTSATTLTSPVVGIKLGAVAFDNLTLGNPRTNSGESQAYWFERDVTSYFTTNFGAGASQTCQVGVQFSGTATINIGAKLLITYEYEEQQTRVKTVRIPLDSGLGALTTTLTEIGTNQIPALSTFLPESSVVIRRVWFELWYNEATAGSTNDASLGMQVDTETEHLTGIHESGMGSSPFGFYIWEQTTATWVASGGGSVHAFKLRSSNVTTASTFNHVGILLCITYEYDHTNSTTILNSLVLGMEQIDFVGATTSSDERTSRAFDISIQEPATVTLVQSGALVFYAPYTGTSVNAKFGSGSYRTYTNVNVLSCGFNTFTQRIDSGGAGGVAFTIARGQNLVYWSIYTGTSANDPDAFSGFVFLNYTSGKHANGDGVHNHSTAWNVRNFSATTTKFNLTASQWINIPESAWYLNDLSIVTMLYSLTSFGGYDIWAEANSGELSEGFECLGKTVTRSDGENGIQPIIYAGSGLRNKFDRWAGDPETKRMDVEGSRRLAHVCLDASSVPIYWWLTYHAITYTISGSISESNGGTVYIKLHRTGDEMLLLTTSRVGDGAYSFSWYDNVTNVYAHAREDNDHVGRSADGVGT